MSRLSVSAEKYDELVETNSKLTENTVELEIENANLKKKIEKLI